MKNISIDVETFSSADLAECGMYRYAESPDFEIILFGYSVDGGGVQVVDLAGGEKLPEEIHSALIDPAVTKWAFNAQFERICLSKWLGLPQGQYLDPRSWRCTMVWAAYMGLPLSLEGAGAVLGLEKQKLKEGKGLVRYFCQPCKPTAANGGRTRNLPTDAPDKWAAFKAYNRRDVETEMAIQVKLAKFPVPESVWTEYHLDQEINDRGVALDMELVHRAIEADQRSRAQLTSLMRELTELENPNSVAQMKQWLSDNGLETDTLGKKAVAELLKKAPEPLGKVLSLRQQLAKSSVKKYQAMENVVCADGRARGMFQFYGANRTGRWAGRLIQLQNLPQNHMPDLDHARNLVRSGQFEALEMLYDSVPEVLSELIRTAFIPKPGFKFIVADFSAIEARVIAWLAGETWRQEVFASGGDIYCASASQMFKVPVEKHGLNSHLRQKGKIAELACIAEGQLVLTDKGLVPIENITLEHKLWDGERWVRHEGVIYKGVREVITYEGLTATPEHLVWVEGEPRPVQLGIASSCGAYLIQTGDGGRAIRLGGNYLSGEKMEQQDESLLCSYPLYELREHPVAVAKQFEKRKVKRLPKLFPTEANTQMAGASAYSGKATLRKPEQSRLQELRGAGCEVRVSERNRRWAVPSRNLRSAVKRNGDRQNRCQRELCQRESSFHDTPGKQSKQAQHRADKLFTGILAIRVHNGDSKAFSGPDAGRDYSRCGNRSIRKAKTLEDNLRTARLYDIRNAGKHHRFTVSGKLVHNCGYGGGIGALKAMGALSMGIPEEELSQIIHDWRSSNPNIVRLWWDVDRAAKMAVKERTTTETHGIRFSYQSGMLFITLPSGRRLSYVKPRIGENRFGSDCITYEGIGGTKKWERIESYGPKLVENIVQATSRDILCHAMRRLNALGYNIVTHVHDEVVIEAPADASVDDICTVMAQTPPWAKGLLLRADGYDCSFYKKD